MSWFITYPLKHVVFPKISLNPEEVNGMILEPQVKLGLAKGWSNESTTILYYGFVASTRLSCWKIKRTLWDFITMKKEKVYLWRQRSGIFIFYSIRRWRFPVFTSKRSIMSSYQIQIDSPMVSRWFSNQLWVFPKKLSSQAVTVVVTHCSSNCSSDCSSNCSSGQPGSTPLFPKRREDKFITSQIGSCGEWNFVSFIHSVILYLRWTHLSKKE